MPCLWKIFCAVMVAGNLWLAIRGGRDIHNTLRTGWTPDGADHPSASRREQPVQFWAFIAFTVVVVLVGLAGAALFLLVALGIIPTTGFQPDSPPTAA